MMNLAGQLSKLKYMPNVYGSKAEKQEFRWKSEYR